MWCDQDNGIVLAAMDATANTVPPEFDVQGYPTLIFVPGNDRSKRESYEGGRDEHSIVEFMRTRRTTPAP